MPKCSVHHEWVVISPSRSYSDVLKNCNSNINSFQINCLIDPQDGWLGTRTCTEIRPFLNHSMWGNASCKLFPSVQSYGALRYLRLLLSANTLISNLLASWDSIRDQSSSWCWMQTQESQAFWTMDSVDIPSSHVFFFSVWIPGKSFISFNHTTTFLILYNLSLLFFFQLCFSVYDNSGLVCLSQRKNWQQNGFEHF